MDDALKLCAEPEVQLLARVLEKIPMAAGEQFIHRICKVLPGQAGELPYVLGDFRLERYSPELFERHGLDFPVHVRNSVRKRQAEFAAGRLCAQSALALHGTLGQTVAIGAQREPLWPQGFIGSITHNARYAAAIACAGQRFLGIGIDLETIVEADARQAIIELVLTPAELQILRDDRGGLDFDCLLTLVFSAKESFFKAAFSQVQAFFGFEALALERIDTARRILHFRCTQTLSEKLPEGLSHEAYFELIGERSLFTVVVIRNQTDPPTAAASG